MLDHPGDVLFQPGDNIFHIFLIFFARLTRAIEREVGISILRTIYY